MKGVNDAATILCILEIHIVRVQFAAMSFDGILNIENICVEQNIYEIGFKPINFGF